MGNKIAAALQVGGVAVLTVAGWTIDATVGLTVAGIGLVVFGVAVERAG